MRPFILVMATLVFFGCSSGVAMPPNTTPTSPPTTGEFGNTLERSDLPRTRWFDATTFARDGEIEFDLTIGCGGDIIISETERLQFDRRFAAAGNNGFVRSDFPEEWDVFIWNEGAADGPDAVIFGTRLTTTGDGAFALTEIRTGDVIMNMSIDPTPPEEWGFCG